MEPSFPIKQQSMCLYIFCTLMNVSTVALLKNISLEYVTMKAIQNHLDFKLQPRLQTVVRYNLFNSAYVD